MTDKKLTDNLSNNSPILSNSLSDNEIIKALKEILELMCNEGDLQRSATISNALDLINRLQAENVRLKDFTSSKCEDCAGCTSWKCDCANIEAQAKAEAYKELLNLLENRLIGKTKMTAFGYEIAIIEIKNLLKELVGEENGNAN